MTQLSQLGPSGHFFKGLRWHNDAWWVSDVYDHAVHTINEDGRSRKVVEVAAQPSGLGWLPDGRLLVVAMRDRQVLVWDGTELAVQADLAALCPGFANDMLVLGNGTAYVGNFGFDLDDPAAATTSTGLVLITTDGSARVVAEGLHFPNACVITPDARTLIVNETLASRHTAFGINPDGTLTGRYTWAQVASPPPDLGAALTGLDYAPEGGCVDAEGCLWVADAASGRAIRLRAGGEILREIRLPDDLKAFGCCLGGPDGKTLLIAAAPGPHVWPRTERRESILLTSQADVPRNGFQD
jgi:sugar lactone lactonase YvrE